MTLLRPVAWITHPSSLRHSMGDGHPECPQRLQAIEQRMRGSGLLDRLLQSEAPAAMILVSAGFDGHAEDPLGNLRLGDEDYSWIAAEIRQVAERCCPERVVAMLEGGYSLPALGRGVEHFLRPFMSGDMGAR